MISEILPSWLPIAASILLVLVEVFFLLKDTVNSVKTNQRCASAILRTLHDFSNGKYYNPWGAQPIVIEPTAKKMTELSDTPLLSQRAVYADMFGFKSTLSNFNHNEINSSRSRLFGLILSVRGAGHLRNLSSLLQRRAQKFLDNELSQPPVNSSEPIHVGLAETCKLFNSRLMAVIFFGEKLASEPEFAAALFQHPLQTVTCMSLFQITPSFLSPLIHGIVTKRGQAMKLIQSRMIPIIQKGVKDWDEHSSKQDTILYSMMTETEDKRAYWTPEALCQAIMGLWFAASHQPWVNLYIFIYQLCRHPEWQDILREELRSIGNRMDIDSISSLPLLDSFMRESARFYCLDKLAIRRKAMQDYTFAYDNTTAPAGATVCVSNWNVTRDASTYPDPDTFDGARFANGKSNDRTKMFADVSEKHLIWGYGSLACPGRLHATYVMKLMIASFITRWDIRLEREDMRSHWMYESFSMPYQSTAVILQPRSNPVAV
ncbi:cytochrome P450 [Aspergillus tamarii]|uniref:Cytochrome P450 n=1 Tax=Aspergillus tamarii TaxID=41984 RepID=A0A5N6VBQ7_ASPTM|nr:cytochrome P450 [Aspergillus tamarii]